MTKSLYWSTFWILVLVGFLNIIATYLYLYWTTSWFDLLMHFLGGLWSAMVVLSVWSILKKDSDYIIKFSTVIWWVVLIGVLWEGFELFIGATSVYDGYAFVRDTVSDIIMDILGALVGAKYGFYLLNKSNSK